MVEVERCGQGLDSLRDRAVGFADGQGVVWRERKGTLSTARLSTEQLDIVKEAWLEDHAWTESWHLGKDICSVLAGLHLSQRQDSHQGQVG